MKTIAALVVMLLMLGGAVAQHSASQRRFDLYPIDKSCACIPAKKLTKTAKATEVREGKFVYQVFKSRTIPLVELFRVQVGSTERGEDVKLWNYGITEEADFNGDGKPDYSWYGGDDTSYVMYLYLSSGEKYKRVDVLKTLQSAWQQRFNTAAPDFADSGGAYEISKTVLDRTAAGLTLLVRVEKLASDGGKNEKYEFSISAADFKS